MNSDLLRPKFAMSRGLIWVDENLLNLPDELEKLNFRVKVVKRGMKDDDIKEIIVDQRFVTANEKDFSEDQDLAAYEYCLISVRAIQALEPSQIAKKISFAWKELSLRTKHTCRVSITRGKPTISYPKELEY